MTITEFIGARLAELEQAAMGASEGGRPERWHWECTEDDVVLDLDADAATTASVPVLMHCGDWRTGLRSRETYPAPSGGTLPHFILDTEDPVKPADARHILLNDPDRTMRTVTGIRRLMAVIGEVTASYPVTAELLCRPVAAIWDDHKDYQARWR